MSDTTDWIETYITYTVWCEEGQYNNTLTFTASPDYLESSIDQGVQAFAIAYATACGTTATNVTKTYTGTGVSNYDFTITSGVGIDAQDGISLYNEQYDTLS